MSDMHAEVDAGSHLEADVAVVGAGLAGLMAARVVAAAGLRPIVLEARDRVGGRTVNEHVGADVVVEMGGQYVAHRDERLRALLTELGIDIFPVYDRGAHLLELERGVRSYRGKLPRVRPLTLLDLGRARWRIDRSAKRVPTTAPWQAPRAREWDITDFGAWLDANVRTREGRSLLHAAFTTIWAEDPHGVNLLGALSRVHEAGGFDNLTGTRGGVLQDRVVGGATRVAEAMAAELDVVCGCPVDAVVDHGSSVELQAGSVRVSARRAIVAVPPVLARRIRFEPELASPRRTALDGLRPGSVIKVALVYEHPFWRDRRLSGRALTVDGPVTTTFDNSPPDGGPGVLIGFVPGPRARALATLPAAERREAVLATFARLFGPEAARPERYLEKDWSADPWSRGCYYGLPAPGAVCGLFPTFIQPAGSIHWAGTETTFRSLGGMNGAVASGERAGGEVLAALSVDVDAVGAR
jgi:monoamine oxidase